MNKNDIMNDMKFRNRCASYRISWTDFDIYGNTIVLKSPKNGIIVLLDEHYNTIDIIRFNADRQLNMGIIDSIRYLYEHKNEKYGFILPYPFQNFSLRDLLELSNRVEIEECNQGHSSDMFVNGELVNDIYDNIYVSLLSYIKFLGEQVEQFFLNSYQMKILGLESPDVYSYINSLMSNIQECVRVKAEKGKRPWPRHVIDYLGQDDVEKYAHMLYSIIDLLLKENGLKIVGGSDHYEDLERVEKVGTDLSEASNRLLKLLQVTDEEIKERMIKRFENFTINEINLESYLSGKVETNKNHVLKNKPETHKVN